MNRGILGVTHGVIVMILIVALVAVSSILLHVMFSRSLTDPAIELMAAALAVVLVVASVGVTIHFQSKAETERQYRVCLFENKMKVLPDFWKSPPNPTTMTGLKRQKSPRSVTKHGLQRCWRKGSWSSVLQLSSPTWRGRGICTLKIPSARARFSM